MYTPVSYTHLQKRIEFWGEGIIFWDYKRLELQVVRGQPGTNAPVSYTHLDVYKRQSIDDADADMVNKLESDTYFNGDETQILFQKALLTLPEKQRIVFNLKYFQEDVYKRQQERCKKRENTEY